MRSKRAWALIAAVALIAAACGGSDEASDPADPGTTAPSSTDAITATTAPATIAPIPSGGSSIEGLHVDEIVFGAEGHVQISNNGDVDISLDGLWLCQFPTYFELSGTLEVDDVILISASDIGGLSSEGGEAAIYTSRDFASSTAIIDYVGWGTGGDRSEVASLAGIWPQGATVSAPDDFIELGGVSGDPESWG